MATFQNTRYINWYNSQNYDRMTLMLPKGSKVRIKARAQALGLSTNEYIKNLIPNELIERGNKHEEDSGDSRSVEY